MPATSTRESFRRGAFGTVFRSRSPSGLVVAIKQVVQDKTFVNREAKVCEMLASGNHPNIVAVKGIFYLTGSEGGGSIMNLVLEFVPRTMRSVMSFLAGHNMRMKTSCAQSYMFQLARALLFLQQHDIVHRDLKPENILINPEIHELKLADFGSAKKIVPGQRNATYIGSRFYRAPELILDRELYSTAIDIWAYGCILAEIAVGSPLFVGEDNPSQLVKIMRMLGTITKADTDSMAAAPGNQLGNFSFRPRERRLWSNVLTVKLFLGKNIHVSFGDVYESLLDGLLQWCPSSRFASEQILAHPFFDELKAPPGQFGTLPPHLFQYTNEELAAIKQNL